MADLLTRAAAAVFMLTGPATFSSAAVRGRDQLTARQQHLVTAAMAAAVFLAVGMPASRLRARVQARWDASFAGQP